MIYDISLYIIYYLLFGNTTNYTYQQPDVDIVLDNRLFSISIFYFKIRKIRITWKKEICFSLYSINEIERNYSFLYLNI